jgi:hypothetical protein
VVLGGAWWCLVVCRRCTVAHGGAWWCKVVQGGAEPDAAASARNDVSSVPTQPCKRDLTRQSRECRRVCHNEVQWVVSRHAPQSSWTTTRRRSPSRRPRLGSAPGLRTRCKRRKVYRVCERGVQCGGHATHVVWRMRVGDVHTAADRSININLIGDFPSGVTLHQHRLPIWWQRCTFKLTWAVKRISMCGNVARSTWHFYTNVGRGAHINVS